jgi:beta-lactamase superfamily II metal-dependent hydrolase
MLFKLALLILAQLVLSVRPEMSFYAIAVGQGDSCIITCPNGKDIIVIDMGATVPIYINPDYITYLLKQRFHAADSGKNIHVLISHSHTDHYSYVSRVLDSDLLRNVREVIVGGNFDDYGSSLPKWLLQNVENVYTINNEQKCFGNKNCTLTSAETGTPIDFVRGDSTVSDPWQFCGSSVKITVLGANIGSTENSKSTVLKFQYSKWSMFTSGDFEMVTPQQELMQNWPAATFRSSYYKVAHHGAWTVKKPNLPDLLDLIQPQKVYISQGYPSLSQFHHPNMQTYQNLIALDSIKTISPSSNAPFVYWDENSDKAVTMKAGLGRAIYETCSKYVASNNTQVCHDIWIKSDGNSDTTSYIAVPTQYLH